MTCRTCKFLDVPLDEDGVRRVLEDRTYICDAPVPMVAHLFPASVRFSAPKLRMVARAGSGCPAWEKRE